MGKETLISAVLSAYGEITITDKFRSIFSFRPNPDRPKMPKGLLVNTDLTSQTHDNSKLPP